MHEPFAPLVPLATSPPGDGTAGAPADGSPAVGSPAGLFAVAAERGRAVQDDLRRDDPRLCGTVHLAYRDGANLTLPHAFLEWQNDWVYVYTRDHGYFVAHKDIVAVCTSTSPQGAAWTPDDCRKNPESLNNSLGARPL